MLSPNVSVSKSTWIGFADTTVFPADQTMAMMTPSSETIEKAANALREGELVAFPTETVYGLGADACNGRAVAKVFEAKGRPRFNPLIVHVNDLTRARKLGRFTVAGERLARAFWPGALTLVMRKTADCPVADLVSAGLDTIALRVPDHPIARSLLLTSGMAIAAPSANRSGHVSPTTAQHVADDLGKEVAVVIDGGPAAFGLESTVVDVSGEDVKMLRPGAVTRAQLEAVLGHAVTTTMDDDTSRPASPGQLASHYAPNARIRLNATSTGDGEALLAFGNAVPACKGAVINLSPHGDLLEAAARLFAALRQLDASGAETIAVMEIPDEGLGEAINDRLRRAAAPRVQD